MSSATTATLGGGGAVRFDDLEDVVQLILTWTTATNPGINTCSTERHLI